ncbi:LIC_13387 family protein [Tahibacter soli]|uniref:Uncharacterized protein n=1 Tax=Tahibacter soli TaxID=2983605 RepID=A0A9X4BH91_9GAMM|nr:hypothetical protein [Tahibacter soli]MDC8012536.1 hypothetical protein [Tahibacter soli]
MLAQSLLAASAAIFLVLGTIHLVYTFASNKFSPRDAALEARLREVSPVISRETSMWNAWIGFNASHSYGATLYGLVYGYLAIFRFDVLRAMPFVLAVGFAFLAGFAIVAVRYWFSIPRNGILLSLALYVAACIAAYA